jgi:hypothetical protein
MTQPWVESFIDLRVPYGEAWRAFCGDCAWSSGTLPFPNPDAALHMHTLHKVLCKGA